MKGKGVHENVHMKISGLTLEVSERPPAAHAMELGIVAGLTTYWEGAQVHQTFLYECRHPARAIHVHDRWGVR